jgi:3-oxoacyl-[acyl-carrier protein] reductase
MKDLATGRPVAVVTGSSSGIGAATARRLAADGFDVVIHAARNARAARCVALRLEETGKVDTHLEVLDFSNREALPAFVDRCFSWKGRVDAWVNNAGVDVLTGARADQPFEEKLQQVLTVDLMATILLSRRVGRAMQNQGAASDSGVCGTIVNMGWDQAATGMAGDSGQMFAASKGAVMAATRSLAQSFAPHVRVNCVAPGWIQTAWGQQAPESWHKRACRESLLNRWGQAEDVAAVISFLCGNDSQFINGQVIPVNGGFRYGGHPE